MKEVILTLVTLPCLVILVYFFGLLASRPKTKLNFFSIALGIALFCSFPIVSKIIGHPLILLSKKINESNQNEIKEIIILTGGIYKNAIGEWTPSKSTENRVFLVKNFLKNKSLPIIISGGFTSNTTGPSEAALTRNYYKLNLSSLEQSSLNTYESSINLKEYCSKNNGNFLLITGKYHSLRSYLSFKTQGCDVIMYNHKFDIKLKDFKPSLLGYSNMNKIIYEYIGLAYYIVTLKINFLKI